MSFTSRVSTCSTRWQPIGGASGRGSAVTRPGSHRHTAARGRCQRCDVHPHDVNAIECEPVSAASTATRRQSLASLSLLLVLAPALGASAAGDERKLPKGAGMMASHSNHLTSVACRICLVLRFAVRRRASNMAVCFAAARRLVPC